MKKLLFVILGVVVFGIFACSRDKVTNTTPKYSMPDTSTGTVIEGVVHLTLKGCPYVDLEDKVQNKDHTRVQLQSLYLSFVEGVRYQIRGEFTDTVLCDSMEVGFHVIGRDSI